MSENFSIQNIEFKENVSAQELTTMKAEANVGLVFYPKNEKELVFIYNYLAINNIKFIVIGNGSNVIFTEKASEITVITTKKIKNKITRRDNVVTINCSTSLAASYRYALKNSLSGFEKLAGIPGNLGGAVFMNASAFSSSIFDYLISVKVLKNGKIQNIKKEKLTLSYRDSGLKGCLVLSAKFMLPRKDMCEIERQFYKYQYLRAAKQPKGLSSGSIFKNPPLISAGKLIEECGLKGFQIGGGKISEKHANFIVNQDNATAEDILKLISLIKSKVYEKYKIRLVEEVKVV